jgi:hypothetical protein
MSEASRDSQAGGTGPIALWFRLICVAYAIAFLGSALATFGPAAIPLALAVIAFWGCVFTRRYRQRGVIEKWLAALIVLWFLLALMAPAVRTARQGGRSAGCASQLKLIAIALLNYHDTYGAFPPAHIPDRNGKPMHSWRVLLLPFLEETSN